MRIFHINFPINNYCNITFFIVIFLFIKERSLDSQLKVYFKKFEIKKINYRFNTKFGFNSIRIL